MGGSSACVINYLEKCMVIVKENKYLHFVNLRFKGVQGKRNDWFWFN